MSQEKRTNKRHISEEETTDDTIIVPLKKRKMYLWNGDMVYALILVWKSQMYCIYATNKNPTFVTDACEKMNKTFQEIGVGATVQMIGSQHCPITFGGIPLYSDSITLLSLISKGNKCCYSISYDTNASEESQDECMNDMIKKLNYRVKNKYTIMSFKSVPYENLIIPTIRTAFLSSGRDYASFTSFISHITTALCLQSNRIIC
jgi:hypothetical protein